MNTETQSRNQTCADIYGTEVSQLERFTTICVLFLWSYVHVK